MLIFPKSFRFVNYTIVTDDLTPYDPALGVTTRIYRSDPGSGTLVLDINLVHPVVPMSKLDLSLGVYTAGLNFTGALFEQYVLVTTYRNAANTFDRRKVEYVLLSNSLQIITNVLDRAGDGATLTTETFPRTRIAGEPLCCALLL